MCLSKKIRPCIENKQMLTYNGMECSIYFYSDSIGIELLYLIYLIYFQLNV